MNIKIGARIRNLRLKANITQEKLANHLGVSVQAVSRWESEICYPDLELIPAIAKYFGVTTDHILCTEQETIKPIEDKFKEEWKNAYRNANPQKALDIINEALLTMPNNFEFMLMKATTLLVFFERICDSKRLIEGDKLLRTIIEILDVIMAQCTNDAIRCSARILKITLDVELNNMNLVIDSAKQLPKVSSTRNSVLSAVYLWDEHQRLKYIRDYLLELILEFSKTGKIMAESSIIKPEERKAILEGIVNIIKIVAGTEHMGEFEEFLDEIYEMLYVLTGADEFKDEIGIHKKRYDGIKQKFEYKSVFLNGVEFNKDDAIFQI